MRLPWPFSRIVRQAQRAPAEGPAFVRGRRREDWRTLPVLARTVGAPPLVAPTPPFRADLAGAGAAPIVLAPLAHERSADGPTGLVSGLAQPISALPKRSGAAAADDLPDMTMRRRAAAPPVPDSDRGVEAVTPWEAQPPAAAAPRAAMPGVQAAPRPSLVRSDRQGPELPPAVGRIGDARRPGAMSAPPRAAAPVEPVRPAASTPASPAAAVGRDPGPPLRPAPDRPTLGQSRRLGLGAPIEPGLLQPARSYPVRADEVAAQPADLPVARAPGSPAGSDPVPDIAAAHHTAQQPPTLTPPTWSAAPPARQVTQAAPVVVHRVPPPSAPIQQRVQQKRGGATVARPTLGARPVPARVQRAPVAPGAQRSGSDPAPGQGRAAGPSVGGPVRVHRGPEAAEMAGALEARAFTHGGEVYLPASHGPLGGQAASSLLAHELTHVVQQRRLGADLPSEATAHGRELEAQAVAAERGQPLPLASRAAPADTADQPAAAGAPTPQLAPASETATVNLTTFDASPPPQRARFSGAASDSGPSPAKDSRSEMDLDELAQRLYSRIDRRLRRDLLDERERSGSLVDLH